MYTVTADKLSLYPWVQMAIVWYGVGQKGNVMNKIDLRRILIMDNIAVWLSLDGGSTEFKGIESK